ncbi:MAG: TM0106 family RecB-like putative nuclease [Dissulfurispiraceae bacterium]|jgi:predicted RecB family nuclease
MNMIITAQLFEDYLNCQTKCYLQSLGDTANGHAFPGWVRTQNDLYRSEGIKRLTEELAPHECINGLPRTESLKMAKWRLAVDFVVRSLNLESSIPALERTPPVGRSHPVQFIPIRFIFTNMLSRSEKLLLAFDALVLSEMLGRHVSLGKIIHGDNHVTLKVRITSLVSEVRKLVIKVAQLISSKSPPDQILNRHCVECGFQAQCRQKAIEKDDLSLLSGMSEKERKKLRNKGIFTVTQLSYTFRPRRKTKRLSGKPEKYHYSLKALAIREGKIYLVGDEKLKLDGTPVYLDVEGLPDREFYYLIGLHVKNAQAFIQHSLWAETQEQEKKIWVDFINILSVIQNPILICYGSFETTFLKHMFKRYAGPAQESAAANAINSPLNLLSFIYARIYFPTYSNGLKDVARYLGFKWSEPNASGIQSILWRWEWERSNEASLKAKLITYNAEDCGALSFVTEFVIGLGVGVQKSEETDNQAISIVKTDSLRRESPFKFQRNQFHSVAMAEINRAAYWDYQREKILLKSNPRLKKVGQVAAKRAEKKLRVNKVIHWPRPQSCPRCGQPRFIKHQRHSKTILDIRFDRSCIKRWVTKNSFYRYRCSACDATFQNSDCNWGRTKFGGNLQAMSVYMNIDLRIPQERVAAFLNQVLGFKLSRGTTNEFKAKTAALYKKTYERLLQKIVIGQLIHTDETRVNVKGIVGYVWVLTSLDPNQASL